MSGMTDREKAIERLKSGNSLKTASAKSQLQKKDGGHLQNTPKGKGKSTMDKIRDLETSSNAKIAQFTKDYPENETIKKYNKKYPPKKKPKATIEKDGFVDHNLDISDNKYLPMKEQRQKDYESMYPEHNKSKK